MAKERNILCDKNEIILKAKMQKGYEFLNFTKDNIKYIKFEKCLIHKLFKQIPTERIEIMTTRYEQPLFFYKVDEKENFDDYKARLSVFAKMNRVTLYDYPDNGAGT